jgi:hypothetical protein
MFNGKFISRKSVTSQKTGNEYYQLELIATTTSGGAKVCKTFCTKEAYEGSLGLSPMQDCRVACGVTENGFLTVSAIKGV